MRTHGQIMYAFYEGHRLIPVHLSFCPIDCKKMLNWLHRAEPKDVPTLWFNFRLTNCAYPTDFNVLRHVLTLWGKMYVPEPPPLLFLSAVAVPQQLALLTRVTRQQKAERAHPHITALSWWPPRWRQAYFRWGITKQWGCTRCCPFSERDSDASFSSCL